ncbi:hypothetical protein ANN_24762 [Periplaneta americana]|uniref:Uncharacterized protein n=1 Tax=Periplaneta americana TaxID=6978 RepID=A0ABQ8S059_PERAM|nr:hypothetical protein ANN_24762 [Periplaneta americana]
MYTQRTKRSQPSGIFLQQVTARAPATRCRWNNKEACCTLSLRGTQITNPKELYEWAKINIPGVDISFMGKNNMKMRLTY